MVLEESISVGMIQLIKCQDPFPTNIPGYLGCRKVNRPNKQNTCFLNFNLVLGEVASCFRIVQCASGSAPFAGQTNALCTIE
jgi:hypothetical protein